MSTIEADFPVLNADRKAEGRKQEAWAGCTLSIDHMSGVTTQGAQVRGCGLAVEG
jgi:hypothetical protein